MSWPKFFQPEGQLTPTKRVFVALVVTHHRLQSLLWQVDQSSLSLVSTSAIHDWYDDASCLSGVDISLQELGPASEQVKHVLFSLESDWVTDQGIVKERKLLFQNLTKQLALEPLGFVVTAEALVQNYAARVHPLNCLVVEVTSQDITLTLVAHSRIVQVQQVGRSEDIASDLIEAFAHIEKKPYPEKIILFSFSLSEIELDMVSQEVMKHDWQADQIFIHPPVVEVLSNQEIHRAIIQTGGKAAVESLGLNISNQRAPPVVTASTQLQSFELAQEVRDSRELRESNEFIQSSSAFSTEPTQRSSNHYRARSSRSFYSSSYFRPVAAGILLGIAAAALALGMYVLETVKVVVKIETQLEKFDKKFELLVVTKASALTPEKILGEVIEEEVSDSLSIPTTAIKKGGDRATGTVTLYNFTDSPKTFAPKTILRSGSLSFVLQDSVNVASASTKQASSTSVKQIEPSTVKGVLTASAPGEASNLKSETELSVESFAKNTYVAVSGELSGGTSRDIPTVSSADQSKLLSTLKKKLEKQAVESLRSKAQKDTLIYPDQAVKVATTSYSAKVGEEAESIQLEMTMKATGVVINLDRLRDKVLALSQQESGALLQLSSSKLQIIAPANLQILQNQALSMQLKAQGVLEPELSTDELKSKLLGQSKTQVESIELDKSKIKSLELQFSYPFYELLWPKIPLDDSRVILLINPSKN